MKLKAGSFCPLIKKDCIELKCAWFTQLRGSNPNTGEEIDDWGCAVGWLPVLLVENSQQQRSTGAAVESFRNEMVKNNENILQGLINGGRQNLPYSGQ
tara:strand:- start:958 stop:1251 length:294 start_codon:yes stop_codon:yes gene_type:complete